MPDATQKKPLLLIPVRADAADPAAAEKPLPAVLQAASRSAGGGPDPFLANVVVEESYTLAAVGRGEAPDTRRIEGDRKFLTLEAADGTTMFMRSDRLQEELARLYPGSGEGRADGNFGTARPSRAGWGTGSDRRSRHSVSTGTCGADLGKETR